MTITIKDNKQSIKAKVIGISIDKDINYNEIINNQTPNNETICVKITLIKED